MLGFIDRARASHVFLQVFVTAFEGFVGRAAVNRIGTDAGKDLVVAGAAFDPVGAIAAVDHVVAMAAQQGAVAARRKQGIAARPAEHEVIAGTRIDVVALKAARQPVFAGGAIHHVGAVAAFDAARIGAHGRAACAGQLILIGRVQQVVAGAAPNFVVAFAAFDFVVMAGAEDGAAIFVVAVELVVAGASKDLVVAITGLDRIVARARVNRVVVEAAEHGVVAVTGDDEVIADAANDGISACGARIEVGVLGLEFDHVADVVFAVDCVVAIAAVERISAAVAVEEVVIGAAFEAVAAGAATQNIRAGIAPEPVGARAADQVVIAIAALTVDRNRHRRIDQHRVVAGARIEHDLVDASKCLGVAIGGDQGLAVSVFDQEDFVAVFGLAGDDLACVAAHVQGERAAGSTGHIGHGGLAQVGAPVQDGGLGQLEAVFVERDKTKGGVDAHLDVGRQKHLERAAEVKHAFHAVRQLIDQLIDIDLAVVIGVGQVGRQCALQATFDACLGHHDIELGAGAYGRAQRELGVVIGAGDAAVVVVEVDALEQIARIAAVHRQLDAAGVITHVEVGLEVHAAKQLDKQRREYRERLAQLKARVEVWNVPGDQVGLAADQQVEQLGGRLLQNWEIKAPFVVKEAVAIPARDGIALAARVFGVGQRWARRGAARSAACAHGAAGRTASQAQ